MKIDEFEKLSVSFHSDLDPVT